MANAELIVHNISQLATCAPDDGAKRGAEMRDVGVINNAAVAVSDGKFVAIGVSSEIQREYSAEESIDAGGRAVVPGLVDPHTHIVYAGDRLNEFELKIKGADYLGILGSGGGIISTVAATRSATQDELVEFASRRLDKMLACGTTTAEVKTGYGLDVESELKMLGVIEELDRVHAIDLVPTLLAAHAIPPEFKNNSDGYVHAVCTEILPAAWQWYLNSRFHANRVPFCADVFCEKNAFDLSQAERILNAAKELGFGIKAHVDQFSNLGGSSLAIGRGALSIDHLDAISDEEVAELSATDTVGIVIPTENFSAGKTSYADARKMIDAGCAIAISTDYNPGSAPCPSLPMAMAIACRYQKLSPSEALNAATINAAFGVGMGLTRGSIEVGKAADMLILDATDHRMLAYEFGGNLIAKVFKNGALVV